ncbi:hypothetical protein HDU85_004197 [Gaertneriomyces sp. JEL0708]|nr:hypothetical protein HDU85_004197 [Gaertneriomyces sp. JEL0708]
MAEELQHSSVPLAAPTHLRRDTLYNWSGVHPIAKRSQIHRPTSEEELCHLVRRARQVCAVGKGLSYEKISSISTEDDAILVDLKHFSGLKKLSKTTATFGAGTSIDQVIKILGEHGRMMPCSPGVIGIQTLGGSISTGTHGQGLYQSSYADIVVSMRVVLPEGRVVTVGGPTGERDLPLEAFITSIGVLGLITEVEIETAERRVMGCKKVTCDFDEFVDNYVQWCQDIEYVKLWWFPETDQVHVWFTSTANPNSPGYLEFTSSGRTHPVESQAVSSALNMTVSLYQSAMSVDTKSTPVAGKSVDTTATQFPQKEELAIPPQFQTIRRFANSRDLVGYSEQILCKGIPVPQINCEIAVPLENFRAATEALRKWSAKNQGRLHYPFIYRSSGKSKAWLNPAFSGPAVYVGLLVYVASDGTVRADGFETMREVQSILARFGGLPHWGKHFVSELYDFNKSYAKWDEFRALRRKIDPTNKLLSSFSRTLFEPGRQVLSKL